MADEIKGESGLDVGDEMFVREWMNNGHNAGKAYLKVWSDVKMATASTRGIEKLKDPMIKAYAAGVVKKHLDDYDITEDRILKELSCIAFLDVSDIVNKDGVISDLSAMPEEARRAVSSVSENLQGHCTVKFCSKEKALELLAKYKRMLTELHEVTGTKDLMAAILAGRERVGIAASGTKTTITVEELCE